MQNTGLLRRFAAILYDTLLIFARLAIAGDNSSPSLFVAAKPVAGGDNATLSPTCAHDACHLRCSLFGSGRASAALSACSPGACNSNRRKAAVPTIASANVRFFAALLSWAPAGLGFLWQLWDKDKLTWHDRHQRYAPRLLPETGEAKLQPANESARAQSP